MSVAANVALQGRFGADQFNDDGAIRSGFGYWPSSTGEVPMLAYLRCLARARREGLVFLIAITGGCAADRANQNPGASATRTPSNVILSRGDACDSQSHHLSVFNKHSSETFAVKVRWYAADGQEITRTVFVEPRTSIELGCAASEEEIVEVTPT